MKITKRAKPDENKRLIHIARRVPNRRHFGSFRSALLFIENMPGCATSRHRQAIEDKKIDFARFWSGRKEAEIHTNTRHKANPGNKLRESRLTVASLFRILPSEVPLGEGYETLFLTTCAREVW